MGIPGAVLFRQRRDHHHRQAYLRRPIHQLCWCNHSPFRHRHPRRSIRRDVLRRWRKGLHVISGFPAAIGVHEGVRPVQAFEVCEINACTVCCHSKPSRFKQASTVQLARTEFCDALTPPVRQQDPTAGGRQLVVVHVSTLSPSSYHAAKAFSTHNLTSRPYPASTDCTSSVHRGGSSQSGILHPSLNYFLNSYVVCSCRLLAKRMDCSSGFTPERPVTAALNVLLTHRMQ